jgi:hypothetical protein
MRSSPRTIHLAITSTITAILVLVVSLVSGTGDVFASSYESSHVQQATSTTVASANTAVTTYKEDTARTGNHSTETILNTNTVKQSTFGKRITYAVDGQIYAQPLFLPNITIKGAKHNVVYVATEHDSIYAFDADATKAGAPLWHTSFINAPRVVSPSNTDLTCNDMIPEDGLSGTPVIDRSTGTLYAVVMTKENGTFVYRLHALDIATGREKAGSPIIIQASVAGKGTGSVNGRVAFLPLRERQRASPLLVNGKVYIAWGSFCDNNPYHGWIMSYSYNGSHLQQVNVYNDTANSTRGGIWGAGGAMSADSSGNIYYVSGNGGFDANTGGSDYGDSFVKLNAKLQVQDYFAPFNQQCLDAEDADLGSGGPLLLPGQERIISAGKEGRIYVINTANMGHYNTIANVCSNQSRTNVDHVVQELPPATIGGLFSNATYWKSANGQQFVYFAGAHDHTKAFALTNGTLATRPSSSTSETFGFTGGNPTISSNNGATGTGILWTVDPTPALRAYDATDLSKELYNSTQNSARDSIDSYVKFAAPTVANGEVFVGTKYSLSIFGMVPKTTPTPTTNGYNNAGVSNDTAPKSANFDSTGNSYSAQALQSAGITPGGSLTSDNFTYTWPNATPGTNNNYLAQGQQIAITPVVQADHLALLGSAINGASSGTATITYTDGSTQTFTLGFSDWAAGSASFGNKIAATMSYRNTLKGKQTIPVSLFTSSVALQAGKTLKNVTLPTAVTGGQLHVFAITTGSLTASTYNNGGITDDSNFGAGNYDGVHDSYSAQALQSVGLNAGDNAFDPTRTVVFTWPDVQAGAPDNYQAAGQTISVMPTSNATILAFLGSATNGASAGTATIKYTDGSTQTFTLGFSDWTLNGGTSQPSYGNEISYTTSYRNNAHLVNGKDTMQTYVFYSSVNLETGKQVASVVLPVTVTGGQMHVFAVTTK